MLLAAYQLLHLRNAYKDNKSTNQCANFFMIRLWLRTVPLSYLINNLFCHYHLKYQTLRCILRYPHFLNKFLFHYHLFCFKIFASKFKLVLRRVLIFPCLLLYYNYMAPQTVSIKKNQLSGDSPM